MARQGTTAAPKNQTRKVIHPELVGSAHMPNNLRDALKTPAERERCSVDWPAMALSGFWGSAGRPHRSFWRRRTMARWGA